jgi:hypothetical protein
MRVELVFGRECTSQKRLTVKVAKRGVGIATGDSNNMGFVVNFIVNNLVTLH